MHSPSVWPHTRLFLGQSTTIAISGPHIQVLDSSTGKILFSTAKFDGPTLGSVLKSGPVRCAALDDSNVYLVTSGDDKKLKVWQVQGLKLLSERELPKKPTEIRFTRDSQTILVSDKFGDVFSYTAHPNTNLSTGSSKKASKDPFASHDNPLGNLVLGHVSLLTTFLLTPDEQYIITADRDEHIRVSWYPQGYNIERFCLGHKKFVSAIHIPDFAQDSLVSGGGDEVIKLWDWMAGTVKHEVLVLDVVRPFIKIKAPKRRRWHDDDDGDDDDIEQGNGIDMNQREQTTKRKRGVQEGQTEEGHGDDSDRALDLGVSEQTLDDAAEDMVLVMHKIASLSTPKQVIFSVLGATALFTFPFPNPAVEDHVQCFDFRRPIINFEISADGRIYVLLDITWDPPDDLDAPARMIRVVEWNGVELVEAEQDDPLLTSLNSECALPANSDELAALDMYGLLSALPKYTHTKTSREPAKQKQSADNEGAMTKRALARLKRKEMVKKPKVGEHSQDPHEQGGDGGNEIRE